MSRVVVIGGGIGGLAAAALIGRSGHEVTLLEANSWLGGKSRRIELGGQRMDTGPSLLTFPGGRSSCDAGTPPVRAEQPRWRACG